MRDKSETPRTDAATHTEEGKEWLIEDCYRLHELSKQLERELTAALKDAERYRWMRANWHDKAPIIPPRMNFDAAIDAAIAAEKQLPPA